MSLMILGKLTPIVYFKHNLCDLRWHMPSGTSLTYTVESQKFEVLGTRDLNSKYRWKFRIKGR